MGPRYAALPSTIPVEPFSPPFHFPFHCFLLEAFSFVEQLLPFRQPQVHLDPSIHKVKLQGDQRVSPLVDLSDEPSDLPFMKQQSPGPQGFMIHPVGLGISTDMGIDEKDLASFDIAVTVSQVDPSVPQGFHLGPQERNPGLVGLLDGIVVKCFLVLTDQLLTHQLTNAKSIALSA